MNQRKNFIKIKRLCVVAMFCAVAYVCMLVVKIQGIAGFLTLDVKDVVIVLCSLLFGPIYGLFIAVFVPLLEMITVSATGPYGFIMNALSSVTFSVVAGVIYKYKKSFYGAIVALVSAVFSVTAVMVLANLLVTPYYMGVSVQDVAALIPKILLPFNLVKATLNGALVLLLYKPLSRVLKKTGFIEKVQSIDHPVRENAVRSVVATIVAALVILTSLAVIFFVLK
ncbi:MAG: ECF transporter S component [Clostridia bacterium]|nr:ECF transporter S component [Clostridia bacterium]